MRAKTKVNKLSFPRSTKWRSLVAGLAVSCLATFFWLFDLTFKPPALWSLRSWKKVAVYDIKAYKHTHLFIFFAPYKNQKKDDKNPAAGEKEEEKPCHKKLFKYYGLSTPENEDFCQPNLLVWWWRTKKISAFFSSPCPKFLTVGHLVCGNWFRLSKLNFGLVGASKIASSLLSLLYTTGHWL